MDDKNEVFWNELCGTQLAQSIGVTDNSSESIRLFDQWFFEFYPYLKPLIEMLNVREQSVLEVGLGYGSVTQLLAEYGAQVTALDVAEEPVNQARHRFRLNKLDGTAIKGSILDAPFPDESFDILVAIGSLHHTGNLRGALAECHRLLRPGGKLLIMVYNAYSYRRWVHNFAETLRYLLAEVAGRREVTSGESSRARGRYDVNSSGESAPHTDWVSKKSLRATLDNFEDVQIVRNNIDEGFPFKFWRRDALLRTPLPKRVGLDLYAGGRKSI